MKFNCDYFKDRAAEAFIARENAFQAKKQWHDTFALLPKKVAPRDCRWLETIERRLVWAENAGFVYGIGCVVDWVWEYRAKETT